MLHNFAKAVFANPKGHEDDLLMICCVDKALIGWHSGKGITIMRERSGGQGFLAANMYGEALASTHAAMTAEGDNRVLMVKVVKDLLTIYGKNQDYFYSGEFIKINDKSRLYCLKTMKILFQMLERYRLDKLISKMTNLKMNGKSNFEILMLETSDEIQELAMAYGERLAISSCL